MTGQLLERGAGILLPVTSLPSPYGIGTFGKAAYEFVDFLRAAGAEILAGAAPWADQLRGQPLPVLFRLRGQSLFYRSGDPCGGRTAGKRIS